MYSWNLEFPKDVGHVEEKFTHAQQVHIPKFTQFHIKHQRERKNYLEKKKCKEKEKIVVSIVTQNFL